MKKSYSRLERVRKRTAKTSKSRVRRKRASGFLRKNAETPNICTPVVATSNVIMSTAVPLHVGKSKEKLVRGILDKTQKLYQRDSRETLFAINSEILSTSELKMKYARFKK